jgi:hypothetical protein
MKTEIRERFCTYGIDRGTNKSQGVFAVLDNGKIKWHTRKIWVARLFLLWMKIKGATIVLEVVGKGKIK